MAAVQIWWAVSSGGVLMLSMLARSAESLVLLWEPQMRHNFLIYLHIELPSHRYITYI